MHQFICGTILGSVLTGVVAGAGTFYTSKGQPNAPTGSIQQFDYFRQRQLFLDAGALRRQADNDHLNQLTKPCAK